MSDQSARRTRRSTQAAAPDERTEAVAPAAPAETAQPTAPAQPVAAAAEPATPAGTAPPAEPALLDPLADVPEEERTLSYAEMVAERLDRPMGALGVIFLFVVLGQTLASDARLTSVLAVVGWVLWVIFAGELALRAYIAQDQRRFWKRNWWQVVFLALPFLRFLRALSVLRFARVARVARVGGVLSSAVRGSRSAGRLLSGRIGWLAVVTGVVILASSQLLYLVGAYTEYADALHGAAMATVTGTPLGVDSGVAKILEVALGVYSVAVFATLAGALGAYFLERPKEGTGEAAPGAPPAAPAAAPVETIG